MNSTKPTLIIIAGPSGVGKSTILAKILPRFNDVKKLRTITTRPKRTGEGDEQYLFASQKEFEALISSGALIEWTKINNHYYGARKQDIDDMLESKIYPIAAIDVKGVREYKKTFPDLLAVFVSYESLEELPERLRATRPDASSEEIERRLNTAREEMQAVDEYEFVVVNREGELEKTVEEIEKIIIEKLKIKKSKLKITNQN